MTKCPEEGEKEEDDAKFRSCLEIQYFSLQ